LRLWRRRLRWLAFAGQPKVGDQSSKQDAQKKGKQHGGTEDSWLNSGYKDLSAHKIHRRRHTFEQNLFPYPAYKITQPFRVDFSCRKANACSMKTSGIRLALVLSVAVIMTAILIRPRTQRSDDEAHSTATSVSVAPSQPATSQDSEVEPAAAPIPPVSAVIETAPASGAEPVSPTNKVERLAQIRETFRALAAGDKTNALRTAKQIVDENERETALLTLVTEWTQGELGSPQLRAERIARVGLEAGLGMELAKNPELALLWADELTKGDGRANILQVTARSMISSDSAAAFALIEQLPEADRRNFSDALFSSWASHDTDAALRWAEQYPDPAEREAAVQAIRTSAPVGIGTALAMQDGYPTINGLVPGTPAERSGQLQIGDRIVAIAQGNGEFMELHDVSLAKVVEAIRGAPNTALQLKVIPADAAPNTPPKTVPIVRDQIKFKRPQSPSPDDLRYLR
jgi:hypothetical protein